MKFKILIKNKFISSILGSLAVFCGIAFILPLNNFSVYITSYIHLYHSYVTMHYGLFISLIFSFANTFSNSLGGYLENLFGFFQTIIIGFIITFITNLFFIFQKDIWLCYFLTLILGIGTGISTSLLGKNITLYAPDKKGLIGGVFGIGIMIIAAIFSLAGEKLINFKGITLEEEDDFYPPKIAKRIYLYFLIGECIIPFGLFLALILIYEYKKEDSQENDPNSNFISDKKENGESLPNNEEKQTSLNEEGKIDENEDKEKNKLKMKNSKKKVKQVIKTFRYWRITLISFFINVSISFMVNTGRTFGALIGINGNALQFAGILQVIAVLILSPFLGILVDKKGPLILLRILAISGIIPGIILAFFMSYTVVFISCFIIYVLTIVVLAVSFGPFIMEVYGIQESVILGGIINGFSKFSDLTTTVSAFGFSIVCEKDEGKKDCLKYRYAIMYLISAVCCGISSILLFFEKQEKFEYKDIIEEDILQNNNNDNDVLVIIPDEVQVAEN